jgi:hypothetical protein
MVPAPGVGCGFEKRGAAAKGLTGGGRTRARTWDPLIKSQLLYQLSYAWATPAPSLVANRNKTLTSLDIRTT